MTMPKSGNKAKNYATLVQFPLWALEPDSVGGKGLRTQQFEMALRAQGFHLLRVAYSNTCPGLLIVRCSQNGLVGTLKCLGMEARRATDAGVRAHLNTYNSSLTGACLGPFRKTSAEIDADVAHLMA